MTTYIYGYDPRCGWIIGKPTAHGTIEQAVDGAGSVEEARQRCELWNRDEKAARADLRRRS